MSDIATAPGDNAATKQADIASRDRVSLGIDFGNGRRKELGDLAWHDGMTVADLMRSATGVAVTQRGAGESAFLTAVDGVANEGANGNNWLYAVNGHVADRSFAVYELRPGDHVLWTFGPQR